MFKVWKHFGNQWPEVTKVRGVVPCWSVGTSVCCMSMSSPAFSEDVQNTRPPTSQGRRGHRLSEVPGPAVCKGPQAQVPKGDRAFTHLLWFEVTLCEKSFDSTFMSAATAIGFWVWKIPSHPHVWFEGLVYNHSLFKCCTQFQNKNTKNRRHHLKLHSAPNADSSLSSWGPNTASSQHQALLLAAPRLRVQAGQAHAGARSMGVHLEPRSRDSEPEGWAVAGRHTRQRRSKITAACRSQKQQQRAGGVGVCLWFCLQTCLQPLRERGNSLKGLSITPDAVR